MSGGKQVGPPIGPHSDNNRDFSGKERAIRAQTGFGKNLHFGQRFGLALVKHDRGPRWDQIRAQIGTESGWIGMYFPIPAHTGSPPFLRELLPEESPEF